MKAAAPHLVPILLEMLLKQEEGQEQVCLCFFKHGCMMYGMVSVFTE